WRNAWVGLARHLDEKLFYVRGAENPPSKDLPFADGRLPRGVDLALGRPMDKPASGTNRPEPVPQSFIGGVAVSPDGARLFAVHVLGELVSLVDIRTGHVVRSVALPAETYTILGSPDGATVYVSLWGGSKVMLFDGTTLDSKGEIAVGEHPNAMALSRDGTRLFVTCANTNAVWAVDLESRRAVEQISVALFPGAPPG